MTLEELISSLEERRATLSNEMRNALAPAIAERRDPSEDESRTYAETRKALSEVDERLTTLRADREAERRAAAARAQDTPAPAVASPATAARPVASIEVRSEPTTYGRGSGHSYFMDAARLATGHGDGDGGRTAAELRMRRHQQELEVDVPRREARRAQKAEREFRDAFGERRVKSFESRAMNRTDGTGGYFVPPLWLLDQYVPYLRAGRQHANAARQLELPAGTDSINIPTLTTGTQTAAQSADGGSVNSRDAADGYVNAPVRTVAGQVDVSVQLLDQSPAAFDEILMADLGADLAMQLDGQTLLGSGSSGQVTGVMPAGVVTGTTNVVYTSGSPTIGGIYTTVAQVISQLTKARLAAPSTIFMHPSRWFWLASQLDSQSRPLMVPQGGGAAFNQLAAAEGGLSFEGPVGWILGLPVILDANIPTSFGGATTAPSIGASAGHTAPTAGTGAGNTQDVILVERSSDIYLWEGEVRSRVLQEILSGTLQVRFQLYEYFAYLANRFGAAGSVGVASGTGLVVPAGF